MCAARGKSMTMAGMLPVQSVNLSRKKRGKTGLFSGSVQNPRTRQPVLFSGALYQGDQTGFGAFQFGGKSGNVVSVNPLDMPAEGQELVGQRLEIEDAPPWAVGLHVVDIDDGNQIVESCGSTPTWPLPRSIPHSVRRPT